MPFFLACGMSLAATSKKHETPEVALARELKEELGIKAQIPTDGPNEILWIDGSELSLFVIESWMGDISNQAPHEHDELRWVRREDLAHLSLFTSLFS